MSRCCATRLQKALLPNLFDDQAEEKRIKLYAEPLFKEPDDQHSSNSPQLPKIDGSDVSIEMKYD